MRFAGGGRARFVSAVIVGAVTVACSRNGADVSTGNGSASASAAADAGVGPAMSGSAASLQNPVNFDGSSMSGVASGGAGGSMSGDLDAATAPLPTDPFLGQLPQTGKAIGHTSVAFKLTAYNGAVAAFKPTSHRGGKRWLGEIAAYKMSLALGLTNVPPAFGHVFARAPLRDALEPAAQTLYDAEVMTDEAGAVEGALVPWVKDLEFPPVERSPLFTTWTTALRHDAPLPAADSPDFALAGQMSTLVAFDLLDANWDRWSGGNVGQKKGTNTYLYIDNDGAFFTHPPQAALTRAWARLAVVDRFSASFVARLRTFGAKDMGNVLEPDVLTAMDQRKDRVLKAIDEKIARYGESKVLVFP